MRPVSGCLDTWELQSVARCLAWVLQAWDMGLKNFSLRRLLMIRHLGFAIGFSWFFVNCYDWHVVLRLAPKNHKVLQK